MISCIGQRHIPDAEGRVGSVDNDPFSSRDCPKACGDGYADHSSLSCDYRVDVRRTKNEIPDKRMV